MNLQVVTKHPRNTEILKRMINSYCTSRDADEKDVLYELAFFKKNHDFKETIEFLRADK